MPKPSKRPNLQDSDPEMDVYIRQVLARPLLKFEIFYSDRSSVYGTSMGEWAQAPSDDVQVVIWQDTTQEINVLAQADFYREKRGTLLTDEEFDALFAWAASVSRIVKGE